MDREREGEGRWWRTKSGRMAVEEGRGLVEAGLVPGAIVSPVSR